MSDKQEKAAPVGGISFYLALFALGFLAAINILSLTVIVDAAALPALGLFAGMFVCGGLIAKFTIRGRFSVFLHEFKHSLLSGLVGNRARGMQVRSQSGHFEYAYSKHTAHMNAFIALAPYWLPVATTCGIVIGLLSASTHVAFTAILGLMYGIDVITGLRDASPEQPDFSGLRGGFTAGVIYLLFSHLLMCSLLIAWIAEGSHGLQLLALGIGQILRTIIGF